MPEELLDLTIYTDYRIIKGLIKNKVNLLKVNNSTFYLTSSSCDHEQQKEDLVDIFVDIDRFIKEVGVKDSQKQVIDAYLNGYTGKDIEDMYGVPTTTSDRWLTLLSKDIANLNRKREK